MEDVSTCLVARHVDILNEIGRVNDKDINVFAVERYAYGTLCTSVTNVRYDDVWSDQRPRLSIIRQICWKTTRGVLPWAMLLQMYRCRRRAK